MDSTLTRKRPRGCSSWKTAGDLNDAYSSISSEGGQQPKPNYGLSSLFGKKREYEQDILKKKNKEADAKNKSRKSSFLTFRMEHREGGTMAQHYGEERILLFRSDQPGAIGKIIYSSTPAEEDYDDEEELNSEETETRMDNTWLSGSSGSSLNRISKTKQEHELERMAQAKVHSLSIKEQYRGYDLGGLLFYEAMSSLRYRYHEDFALEKKGGDDDGGTMSADAAPRVHSSVRCQLDAEEDIRRHNKLVGFYEHLGCHVKPNTRINYINNNDGETYRKIPMQIILRPCDDDEFSSWRRRRRYDKQHTSYDNHDGISPLKKFLPVTLLQAPGKQVEQFKQRSGSDDHNSLKWLLIELGDGNLLFRTTSGLTLVVDNEGLCHLSDDVMENDRRNQDSMFYLERLLYECHLDGDVSGRYKDSHDMDETEHRYQSMEFWMIKSTHDSYLAVDPYSHLLCCSDDPSFWRANGCDLSLECMQDTPARREYYRTMWILQTVEYNKRMRERYLNFSICKMSFKNALNIAKDMEADPFQLPTRNSTSSSLRGLLYRTAESARAMGHPDWVQLIALIHGLGRVLSIVLDDLSSQDSDSNNFDWTLTSRSRIVGCRARDGSLFEEFRCLNGDEMDHRYNTEMGCYQPGCGLENTSLSWTGPEYMYHMLKHNQVNIPDEGLWIVRYFSLQDWHKRNQYSVFVSLDDEDVQSFVSDFDDMLFETQKLHLKSIDLDDESCELLWDTHYSHIAKKYGADGILSW